MTRELGPVSAVYKPTSPTHRIEDEPIEGHYEKWGYSIGYELDENGNQVPKGGNTAIFRIAQRGLTEPVYVTKPETDSTFTVNVLSGVGLFIRARVDGQVDKIPLTENIEIIVHPGEAYTYANTGDTDLVLHDVALPAFKPGDDADISKSLVPTARPEPKEGYSATIVATSEGHRIIELPNAFFDAMSELR